MTWREIIYFVAGVLFSGAGLLLTVNAVMMYRGTPWECTLGHEFSVQRGLFNEKKYLTFLGTLNLLWAILFAFFAVGYFLHWRDLFAFAGVLIPLYFNGIAYADMNKRFRKDPTLPIEATAAVWKAYAGKPLSDKQYHRRGMWFMGLIIAIPFLFLIAVLIASIFVS